MAAAHPLLRPVLLGLAGLVLCVAVADTALWVWTNSRLSQGLAQWEADQAVLGLRVTHSAPVWAGWPLAAALMLPHAGIAAAPGSVETGAPALVSSPVHLAAWAWQADAVTLTISPWHPEMLMIQPSGAQSLTFGRSAPLPIVASGLDIEVPLSGAPGELVHAQGHGIQLTGPGGVSAISRADLQFDASHIVLSLRDLALPPAKLPFDGLLAAVTVAASTTVPVPPAADWQDAATAWRNAGGRLLIQRATLQWGPLNAEATGSLSLNGALQPEGTAALHLTGYGELIEALARSGSISRNDARVAATLLGLLAHKSPGAPDFVDLPLTAQDGLVSIGAIPLMRLPRAWLP